MKSIYLILVCCWLAFSPLRVQAQIFNNDDEKRSVVYVRNYKKLVKSLIDQLEEKDWRRSSTVLIYQFKKAGSLYDKIEKHRKVNKLHSELMSYEDDFNALVKERVNRELLNLQVKFSNLAINKSNFTAMRSILQTMAGKEKIYNWNGEDNSWAGRISRMHKALDYGEQFWSTYDDLMQKKKVSDEELQQMNWYLTNCEWICSSLKPDMRDSYQQLSSLQ
jgi:hypothetical protein